MIHWKVVLSICLLAPHASCQNAKSAGSSDALNNEEDFIDLRALGRRADSGLYEIERVTTLRKHKSSSSTTVAPLSSSVNLTPNALSDLLTSMLSPFLDSLTTAAPNLSLGNTANALDPNTTGVPTPNVHQSTQNSIQTIAIIPYTSGSNPGQISYALIPANQDGAQLGAGVTTTTTSTATVAPIVISNIPLTSYPSKQYSTSEAYTNLQGTAAAQQAYLLSLAQALQAGSNVYAVS